MNTIYAKILEVSKRENSNEIYNLEAFIEQELKNDPHNTDLLVRLGVLVHEMPFADNPKSVEVFSKILEYDPHNGLVMILQAYMYYWYTGMIKKEWYGQLSTFVTGNAEIDSMMRFVASLYYETAKCPDEPAYEKLLINSINLCQDHVKNYKALAELYLKQGKFAEAEMLAKAALKNVVKIYVDNSGYPNPDITDYFKFLAEFVKGTHLTDTATWRLRKIGAEASARYKLQIDPDNMQALIDLVAIESFTFSLNHEPEFVFLKKLLLKDPNNSTALLLLAHRAYGKPFDELLIQKLLSNKQLTPEINSMFLFAASRLYINKDAKKCEELLLKSIKEYPYHVHHYLDLAKIYIAQNKLIDAQEMKQKAFNNVARVLSIDEEYKCINIVESFINKDIKGIWLSESFYKKLYEEISQSR